MLQQRVIDKVIVVSNDKEIQPLEGKTRDCLYRSDHLGLHPWGWTGRVRRVRQVTPGSGRLEPVSQS